MQSKNRHRFGGVWRLAITLWVCWSLSFSVLTQASQDVIEIYDVSLEASEPPEASWLLSANFKMELSSRLEEAVNRGLPLVFITDIEVSRPRWYWFDEKSVSQTQTYRLSYHALTRQYRVSTGVLNQRFDSLPEAIGMLKRIRRLNIAKKSELKPGAQYEVAVRMRLDTTQLPKPFQVNALTSKDWNLYSDWKRVIFTAPVEPAK
ncbi:MAG: DUF4390 domain-containing protein [Burkholderiales bacterium]|jgi:hypothetical protein|nr:DUF4390 domain-containing protein [Burkholderiales bacterium]